MKQLFLLTFLLLALKPDILQACLLEPLLNLLQPLTIHIHDCDCDSTKEDKYTLHHIDDCSGPCKECGGSKHLPTSDCGCSRKPATSECGCFITPATGDYGCSRKLGTSECGCSRQPSSTTCEYSRLPTYIYEYSRPHTTSCGCSKKPPTTSCSCSRDPPRSTCGCSSQPPSTYAYPQGNYQNTNSYYYVDRNTEGSKSCGYSKEVYHKEDCSRIPTTEECSCVSKQQTNYVPLNGVSQYMASTYDCQNIPTVKAFVPSYNKNNNYLYSYNYDRCDQHYGYDDKVFYDPGDVKKYSYSAVLDGDVVKAVPRESCNSGYKYKYV